MRTFKCLCGGTLFFENTHCGACQREVGWCDVCDGMTTLTDEGTCSQEACGSSVKPCANRQNHAVCNRFLSAGEASQICRSCCLTAVVPDGNNPQQVLLWRIIEAAKRRLLYDLRLVGFSEPQLLEEPALSFRFLADQPGRRVMTGHAAGVITINLAEADSVEREKRRQRFGEPHRTVIGHLRHECGHYLWMRLVEGKQESQFCELFGDYRNPAYEEAMELYYEQGVADAWQERYISQYAAAHPWEDFAETAGFYLDMKSVIDTVAWHAPTLISGPAPDLDGLLANYLSVGIALNEVNRTMGLTDLVPEVVTAPVQEKLRFVHTLLSQQSARARPALQVAAATDAAAKKSS